MKGETGNAARVAGAVYVRAEGVILRSIAGEALLVPIRKDLADMREVFTLNPIGVVIWQLLDGFLPLSGLLSAVLERYEVAEEQASADLVSFMEQLSARGLIERRV